MPGLSLSLHAGRSLTRLSTLTPLSTMKYLTLMVGTGQFDALLAVALKTFWQNGSAATVDDR